MLCYFMIIGVVIFSTFVYLIERGQVREKRGPREIERERETGHLTTPYGDEYDGFKITVGGIQDPAEIKRTYDDIEEILGKNQIPFKTHEVDSPSGKFRSYSVSTN